VDRVWDVALLSVVEGSTCGWWMSGKSSGKAGRIFSQRAQLIRRILTDFALSRSFQKRGGDAVHVPLDKG